MLPPTQTVGCRTPAETQTQLGRTFSTVLTTETSSLSKRPDRTFPVRGDSFVFVSADDEWIHPPVVVVSDHRDPCPALPHRRREGARRPLYTSADRAAGAADL